MRYWRSISGAATSVIFFCGAPLAAQAAQQPLAAPLPACRADLDSLQVKVRENYAGYLLEVKGEKLRRYESQFRALSARADSARGEGCFEVLRDYIAWFDDPHLFLFQSSRIDSLESITRARNVALTDWTEPKARRYFASARRQLDPIEGIWYDRELRLAVVPEPGATPGHFVAVVVAPDTTTWRVGSVRARITKQPGDEYQVVLSSPNYSVQRRTARIHRRVLLRMSPGIWGKAFPVPSADSGSLDAFDPKRPTLKIRGGTVVVAIPSHDPAYRSLLDSLIGAHSAELLAADHLVIDLRGNEGGAAFTSRALEPYLRTAPARLSPYDSFNSTMLMLSSADQIRYARRSLGPDTSRFVRSLVARMQANPGQLVPFIDPEHPEPADEPLPPRGKARVAVLIDRGTVSAAETLVLKALQSERAIVIGEPTAGALDYMSVSIVPFAAQEWRWRLGYPTIAAHAELPRGGMRGAGIGPDVYVDWSRVLDAIAEADRLLSRMHFD